MFSIVLEVFSIEEVDLRFFGPHSLVWLFGLMSIIAYHHKKAKEHAERQAIEDRLKQSAIVFQGTKEGILITDHNFNIKTINQAFTDITGFTEQECKGQPPNFLHPNRKNEEFFKNLRDILSKNGQWQGEVFNRRKRGDIFPAWMRINVVRNSNNKLTNIVWLFSDLSELNHWKETLLNLVHYDPLTNLPNRLLLTARLEQKLERAQRNSSNVAVLLLDLDRFKYINDSLGHSFGDDVIKATADRLRESVRNQDTLARIGGDEFIFVMEDITRPQYLGRYAQQLIDKITPPIKIRGHEFRLSTCIGISIYPNDGTTASELISHAEAAMYQAKDERRNNYRFYTKELTYSVFEKIKFEDQFHKALDYGELIPYFQPQISLLTNEVIGVEALARWPRMNQSIVSAENFMQLAYDSGLIVPLSEQILRKACFQMQEWLSAGLNPGIMAVNLSGKQIQYTKLQKTVSSILSETACPPEYLELEISEDFFMKQERDALKTLNSLRDIGVALSIDDFGIGYSSLSKLKHLPVNQLKIDRSFVRDINENADDQAIIETIITLGRTMGMNVIAEGVENEKQLDFLRNAACHACQGFYYSEAIPAAQFPQWLNDWNSQIELKN